MPLAVSSCKSFGLDREYTACMWWCFGYQVENWSCMFIGQDVVFALYACIYVWVNHAMSHIPRVLYIAAWHPPWHYHFAPALVPEIQVYRCRPRQDMFHNSLDRIWICFCRKSHGVCCFLSEWNGEHEHSGLNNGSEIPTCKHCKCWTILSWAFT